MLSSALVLTLFLAACGGAERDDSGQVVEAGDVESFDLRAGDCFNDEPDTIGTTYEFTSLPVVPCVEPHDNEIYAAIDYPAAGDAEFPGNDAILEFGDEACFDAFEPYVGAAFADSRLVYDLIYPTEEGWQDFDDREVLCYLYDMDLAKLTGSMRDSGE